MQVISTAKKPVKLWNTYVDIEDEAIEQLINLANMPFTYRHVAAMPDAHWGMGACIGSVYATKGAIIPASVGVDIGCGMVAQQTPLKASDLPDNLTELRAAIEKAIPHGRTNQGKEGDRGAWHDIPEIVKQYWSYPTYIDIAYHTIIQKHPAITPKRPPWHHLGTLGTGNHFIELCLDQHDHVWIMLHSGSRGIGNKIGMYFIEKAKEEMAKYHIDKFLPDQDLAYLVEHSEIFDDYVFAVDWAQHFAMQNRRVMLELVKRTLAKQFSHVAFNGTWNDYTAVNCHHNYVEREHHFGQNVLVTRKGAVRVRQGELGIIPGSMGAKSFIVSGKGNPESFHSCSHGAGRAMSRNEAKKRFTVEDHAKATAGVECRKDQEVIDETPMAYKDIDAVMQSQLDLVDVIYTLKQFLCVKG